MSQFSYVRNSLGAVRPYVYGPTKLLELVTTAFGATVIERHELGTAAWHIEVSIGDSALVLELSDPPHATGFPGSIYVYVPDVDLAYVAALKCDVATISVPDNKPYGERQAGIRDEYGNVWWIATMLPDESKDQGAND